MNMIQTLERFKRRLFIRTKHSMAVTSGVIPISKLPNST